MRTVDEVTAETVREVGRKMLVAAQTAPKARGQDNLFLALIEDDEITRLADAMDKIGTAENLPGFIRDAKCLRGCSALVLIGTKIKTIGLKKCGLCGFTNCAEKEKNPETPCVFNTGDLGIAIGSAVSVAMDNRIDNRIMYSVGIAACQSGILPAPVKVAYGIPLSATAKSPFFDR
jgi:uncharacterized ferredoxin-like protein